MSSGYPASPDMPWRTRRSMTGRLLGRHSAFWQLDFILLIAVALLLGLGSLLVWSATKPTLVANGASGTGFLQRHLLNAVIGLILMTVAASVDYRTLRAYTPVIYGASCLGLLAVLSPLGSTINGAHSWIKLPGGFTIQPSEFAKIGLVLGVAMLLGENRDGETRPRTSDVLQVLAYAMIPLGLIMLQPDLGTAVVLSAIILGAFAMAGVQARWIAGLLLAAIAVGFASAQLGVLHDYQVKRLTSFTNPQADLQGAGYNTAQARIAIGAGGVTGTGLFQGTQTNGRFIPEQQTDFIFTVAGEELGLVGGGGVIFLLGVVMWRGLRIASRCDDGFGSILAVGVVSWFAFQSFVNVGMTLGIMPVTGLPLPFISYGGSSMFANLIAIGLLQNVYLRTKT